MLLAACGDVPDTSGDAATSTCATACGDTSSGADSSSTTGGESSSTDTTGEEGDSSSSSTGEPMEQPELPTCPRVRSEVDRPDDSELPQIRVLYVLPSDIEDGALDVDGQICRSVQAWSAWLLEQADDRMLRLDTEGGALDIGFVRLALDDATMHGTSEVASIDTGVAYVRDRIERELAALPEGLAPQKVYAVYYGGTSEYACGGGAFPPTLPGRVGAMYLGGQIPGYPACDASPWGEADGVPRYIDYGMLHELVHTLGAVDLLAPHEQATGHTFDDGRGAAARDLMYAPRPDADDPPWAVAEGLLLDPGRDDYFDHGDRDLLDVARSAFLVPLPDDPELPPAW